MIENARRAMALNIWRCLIGLYSIKLNRNAISAIVEIKVQIFYDKAEEDIRRESLAGREEDLAEARRLEQIVDLEKQLADLRSSSSRRWRSSTFEENWSNMQWMFNASSLVFEKKPALMSIKLEINSWMNVIMIFLDWHSLICSRMAQEHRRAIVDEKFLSFDASKDTWGCQLNDFQLNYLRRTFFSWHLVW